MKRWQETALVLVIAIGLLAFLVLRESSDRIYGWQTITAKQDKSIDTRGIKAQAPLRTNWTFKDNVFAYKDSKCSLTIEASWQPVYNRAKSPLQLTNNLYFVNPDEPLPVSASGKTTHKAITNLYQQIDKTWTGSWSWGPVFGGSPGSASDGYAAWRIGYREVQGETVYYWALVELHRNFEGDCAQKSNDFISSIRWL